MAWVPLNAMSTTPSTFYRYRGFSAATMDLLCGDQLYFSSPSDFNDPFDCQPEVVGDSDLVTLRALYRELVNRQVSGEVSRALKAARLKGNKADAHARHRGEKEASNELGHVAYLASDPDYDCSQEEAEKSLLLCRIKSALLQQYDKGICCFSEAYNNMLLWSHYGDEHRGFCIGYGLDRKPDPVMHQVAYGESRVLKSSLIAEAILSKNEQALAELDRCVLLRKAPDWGYEKEWRLFGNVGTQESCLLLTDITFGWRCPETIKHVVISALERRAPNIKFFEIANPRGSFELSREEVDLSNLRRYFPNTARSGTEAFGDGEF